MGTIFAKLLQCPHPEKLHLLSTIYYVISSFQQILNVIYRKYPFKIKQSVPHDASHQLIVVMGDTVSRRSPIKEVRPREAFFN